MASDVRTRWQGIYVRHRNGCGALGGRRCSCEPGYMARVWDRRRGRQLRSPTFRSATAAWEWRVQQLAALAREGGAAR